MLKISPQILGMGAFGQVYEGSWYGCRVAVKIIDMNRSPSHKRCAEAEAETLSQVAHPHIVSLMSHKASGSRKGLYYIVLEPLENGSLKRLIYDSDKPLSQVFCESITKDIVSGLECLHSKGFVHRDIKPSNILLTSDNKAKIADFGLSLSIDNAKNNKNYGTPRYLSPQIAEQIISLSKLKEPQSIDQPFCFTPFDDVWALGITVVEMLDQKIPYSTLEDFEFQRLWVCIVNGPNPIPSHASSFLASIIKQCLQRDSTKRASAKELAVLFEAESTAELETKLVVPLEVESTAGLEIKLTVPLEAESTVELETKLVSPTGLKNYSGNAYGWLENRVCHTHNNVQLIKQEPNSMQRHSFWSKANQEPIFRCRNQSKQSFTL